MRMSATKKKTTVTFVFAIVAALVITFSPVTFAQPSRSARSFASADQASQALYEAVADKDEQAIQNILGAGPELTSSGEAEADTLDRERFTQKYKEMHRLVREPDGSTVLYVGAENWPFPIPLVEKSGKWHFDADAGTQEVLARHIGRDEMTAIGVGKAFANTSNADDVDDSIKEVAAALHSVGGENPNSMEYQGYYFRVLANELRGVVLIMYPAEYRLSGVMTFVVTADGSVYENDLGLQTAERVQRIQGKPDKNWVLVQ